MGIAQKREPSGNAYSSTNNHKKIITKGGVYSETVKATLQNTANLRKLTTAECVEHVGSTFL